MNSLKNIKLLNLELYLVFSILIIGSLFTYSINFIDNFILPKWYVFYLSVLIYNLLKISNTNTSVGESSSINKLFIYILVLFIYILLRNIITELNINTILLCFSLFSLLFFFRRLCFSFVNMNRIYLIITLACSIQAIYGLIQYFGLYPSYTIFRITGSFDNPIGFSASLTASVPFFFPLINHNKRLLKIIATILLVLTLMAVFLSESRSCILACVCILGFWGYKRLYNSKKSVFFRISCILLLISFTTVVYFLKKDSANGRVLIWICTLEQVKQNPLLGLGPEGFKTNYMLQQANYFRENPKSIFSDLADNVGHPFNEYLLFTSEYGIIGLILIILIIRHIFSLIKRDKNSDYLPATLCLLSISIIANFSYPLKYPFIVIMIFFCLALISIKDKAIVKLNTSYRNYILIPCTIILLIYLMRDINLEYRWNNIAKNSLMGQTSQMIPEYNKLSKTHLRYNPMFLYNYGAELCYLKKYRESLYQLHLCEKYYNSYDLQMLIANCYYELGEWQLAENRYTLASNMCPARFRPLYKLVKVYEKMNKIKKSQIIAKNILDKEIKTHSAIISNMRREMQNKLINELESNN